MLRDYIKKNLKCKLFLYFFLKKPFIRLVYAIYFYKKIKYLLKIPDFFYLKYLFDDMNQLSHQITINNNNSKNKIEKEKLNEYIWPNTLFK